MRRSPHLLRALIVLLVLSYIPGIPLFGLANKAYAAADRIYAPTELRLAPASSTDNSAVLVWEKPSVYTNIVSYNIYRSDGSLIGKTPRTYFKALGLSPNTTYNFIVRAQDAAGHESLDSNAVQLTTKPQGQRFNVKDYGATGDGSTLDTAAIQAALDACTPGGTVYFPAGTYLSGALFINHSHITVYVEGGAQIKPSVHKADFMPFVSARHDIEEMQSYASLFNAGMMDRNNFGFTISDIAFIGPGTIGDEKNGLDLRVEYDDEADSTGIHYGGGSLISLKNVQDVYLDGLQIRNGMMWTIVPIYSKNITAYGLDINTTVHNGDGFDPNSSENVYILSSTFQTGDDSSAIKSGKDQEGRDIGRPSRFIYYRGDTFSGGHGGIVLGSEMSGGVSDVYAEDNILTPIDVGTSAVNAGFKIKTSTTRGGYIRNIQIRDSLINRIELNSNYDKLSTPADFPPDITNLRFINLRNSDMTNASNIISLTGSASTATSDNYLKNVQFINSSFYQAQLTYTENIFFDSSTFTQPISATKSLNIVQDGAVVYDHSFPVYEDFSEYTPGALPSGYWTVQSGSSYIAGAVKIHPTGNLGPNSLSFDDQGAGYASALRTFTPQTGKMTAQVSVKMPAPPKLTGGLPNGTFAATATGSHNIFQLIGSDGKIAVSLTTQNNGALNYTYKSGTGSTIIPVIPLDTWFQLKVDVDYANKKADVYYNGMLVAGGLPFYDTTAIPKDINTFKSITPNNNTTVAAQAYLDELIITAPASADQGYGINVSSVSGISSITQKGAALQLAAAKTNAGLGTPSTVTWGVYKVDLTPTDAAVISNNGLLKALKNGSVVVTASMNDGSQLFGLMPVEITGQETPTGIKQVDIETAIGKPPVLPSVVSVLHDDGAVAVASVVWDTVDASLYAQAGSFPVHGTVADFSQQAVAAVTVSAVKVKSYQPVVIKTKVGAAPRMPEKVTAVFNNHTSQLLPVVWDAIAPNLYDQTNVKGFTVQGTVQGSPLKAVAQVAVLPVVVPGVTPILVAADGSGDYRSIQDAIDAVPENNRHRVVIFIKNGIYYEKVLVPSNKPYITLYGESEDGAILTFDDNPKKIAPDGTSLGLGTYTDYTLMIQGHDFTAKQLTIANTSGSGAGQSVAVDVNADRAIFDTCKILGYQDTLLTRNLTDNADPANYANNNTVQTYRSYYKNSYIAGSVDFIFGNGAALFENTEVHSRLAGHVTAASTPQGQKYGYVFLNSRITGEYLLGTKQTATGPVDLGRPWRPYAQTVFVNSFMDKHIATVGWNSFGKATNEATAYYGEYQSSGPGANASGRLGWTHQLTNAEAQRYTMDQIFQGSNLIGVGDNWDPTVLTPNVQVAAVQPVTLVTAVGVAPMLPSTVDAAFSDGTNEKLGVAWDAMNPAQYAQEGNFTLSGIVEGTEMMAQAVITVHAGAVLTGPSEIISGQPLDVYYGWTRVSQQVYGLDVTFQYDPDKLQFKSVESTTAGVSVIDQSAAAGQVRVLLASTVPGISFPEPANPLLALHFTTNSTGALTTTTIRATEAWISDGSLVDEHETDLGIAVYQVNLRESVQAAVKTALMNKIAEAENRLAHITTGNHWGQYAQSAIDQLRAEIAKAQAIVHKEQATQAEVDQAAVEISAAFQRFASSVNTRASIEDLAIAAVHYGIHSDHSDWPLVQRYDLNGDLQINIFDLGLLARLIERNEN